MVVRIGCICLVACPLVVEEAPIDGGLARNQGFGWFGGALHGHVCSSGMDVKVATAKPKKFEDKNSRIKIAG